MPEEIQDIVIVILFSASPSQHPLNGNKPTFSEAAGVLYHCSVDTDNREQSPTNPLILSIDNFLTLPFFSNSRVTKFPMQSVSHS